MMNAIESNNVNLCHELLKELADEQMKVTKVVHRKEGATLMSIWNEKTFLLSHHSLLSETLYYIFVPDVGTKT